MSKSDTFAAILVSVMDLYFWRELQHATSSFLDSRRVETNLEALICRSVRVYHRIQIPVTNMHGDQVIQTIRCTGEQTWHGQGPRNKWVWVEMSRLREGQKPVYKALRGRVPYRLLKLFNLQVLGVLIWCAFVQTTIPSVGGIPERASGMVRVSEAAEGSGYAVISGGNITGAAHLIPEEPMAKRPRTATSEDNRTKVPKVTNSIRRAVSGAVQVKATLAVATPDVTSDSASSPSITTSAMRWWAAQSPHCNSLVPAPTSSEVLSVASGTSNGRRSIMHQGSMPLAFVLNTVKRLLEQHTMKHQPFLREDEIICVSCEYYPRCGFYLSC